MKAPKEILSFSLGPYKLDSFLLFNSRDGRKEKLAVREADSILEKGDRGGRRSGVERRKIFIPGYTPERRSGEDRRSGQERRSLKEPRKSP
jgi:hypothetical protein